jgi:hypothetical protein
VVQRGCLVWRAAVRARAVLQAWQVADPADRVDLEAPAASQAPEAQGKITGRQTSTLRKGP